MLLLAALGQEEQAVPPNRVTPAEVVAATPGIARQVERIRELRFERIPRPKLITTEQLTRRFRREARRTGADADLRDAEVLLGIVGLIEPGDDLSGLVDAVASDVAGAYDPRGKELYVIEDAIPDEEAVVEVTIAHELTHALEDQVFGLRDSDALSDDRTLAYDALTEGSATAVMIQFAAERNLLGDLLLSDAGGSDIGEVPGPLQAQLVFPYLGGQEFIQELRRAGGDWDLVDVADREDPPVSSAQILHPEKYLAGDLPQRVHIQPLPDDRWRRVDSGDVGEFDVRQLTLVGADDAAAARAGAGWAGGRFAIWRRRGESGECEPPCRERHVVVIKLAFEDRADAGEFLAVQPAYFEALGAEEAEAVATRVRAVLLGGAAAAALRGRTLTLAFAPSLPLATRLSLGS